MKIFTDDPLVKYVNTTIDAERTRDEISAKLREYEVADIHWHWKPEINDIFVQFGIEENIDGQLVKVMAKVICPAIWNKANSRAKTPDKRIERIDLNVSMRAMFWYIKSTLENSYAMQSSRVAGFLSDMVTPNGTRFFDEMKERLDQYKALEYEPTTPRDVSAIKQQPKNVTYDVT